MREDTLLSYAAVRRARALRRRPRAHRGLGAIVLAGSLILFVGAAGLIIASATVGAAVAATAYNSFTESLPSVSAMGTRDVFKTTRILDRHGNLLYELFDQSTGKRTIVRLVDLPPNVINAFLAAEDATFYENPGIEPRGIARAIWQNVRAGSVVSGGSTITQQLIRNVLLDPEERTSETMTRKLKEAALAIELSANYGKPQILEWYLNEIYFGNLSYGVGTAARTYFNKAPHELTLAEAALLAGLPQAPNRYDPFRNYQAAKNRQEYVLALMARHGFISWETAEAAQGESIQFVPPETALSTIRYPHWVFYVRSLLEERYGADLLATGGFTVYTTLDPNLQDIAEESVRRQIGVLASQGANNASLVAIEPTTGEILAMVGSPDYYDALIHGQVNAALTPQQPGSSIKPIVYLAAFLKGLTPGSLVADEAISLPDGAGGQWRPQNFDNAFRGPVTLRRALGNSLNIPAVKVLQYAGLADTVALARRLGMTSLGEASSYGLAFTLGGGDVRLIELTAAYTVLANGGAQVPIAAITKIVDSEGRVVFAHQPTREQLVDARAAYMVTDVLSDNGARTETFGPNSPLRLPGDRPAAAKTGSTEDYRDSWTMGYTPSLVAGVWVGRHDDRPMRQVLGSSGAGLIWNAFMRRALENWPIEPFEPPPGLVKESTCLSVDPETSECSQFSTDWVLQERSRSAAARLSARTVAVDRMTGKLADRDTPYTDVDFLFYRPSRSVETAAPPREYSGRTGPTRPWELLPATLVATVLPGPSATPDPNTTATPTMTPLPTRTPAPTATATPEALIRAVPLATSVFQVIEGAR